MANAFYWSFCFPIFPEFFRLIIRDIFCSGAQFFKTLFYYCNAKSIVNAINAFLFPPVEPFEDLGLETFSRVILIYKEF